MTCAIYCRLSKEDEEKTQESESIQNQKSMLLKYALEQDWDVYNLYCDEDYSGVDRHRPAWNDMLEAAKNGKFSIILCKTQSRFTRDMELVEKYIHGLFPVWGIRFVAVVDNIDTDVKGNKKARQINGLINEWYLEDLSENIRAVFAQKRSAGQYIGSFPIYGYRKDPANHNHLLVDTEAAETVRQIFRMYLEGTGTQNIAYFLNGQSVPNPAKYKRVNGPAYVNGRDTVASGLWNHTTVGRILKNELYTGMMVQGVKRKVSYKSEKLANVPKDKWIRVDGTHEAIIDRDMFDSVQRRIRNRARTDGSGEVHILANKVKCIDCGSVMQRLTHTYKGIPKSYLQCKLYSTTRNSPLCTKHTIRLDELTELVEERIRAYTSDFYELSDVKRFQRESNHKQDALRFQKEITALKSQETKLTNAIKSLYLDKVDGLISQEQFLEMNRSLLGDKQSLQARIMLMEQNVMEMGEKDKDDNALAKQIDALMKLDTISRELIDLLIDSIEVGDKNLETNEQQVRINWKI